MLHRLAERGLLDYFAPVAQYWPEFGANGKKNMTVIELLSHRPGLSHVAPLARNLCELLDRHLIEERIATAAPGWWRGMPADHAISYGWLAARSDTGIGSTSPKTIIDSVRGQGRAYMCGSRRPGRGARKDRGAEYSQ